MKNVKCKKCDSDIFHEYTPLEGKTNKINKNGKTSSNKSKLEANQL